MSRRTPKVEALVVNAIRRLQDVQGSTSREISNYISQEYDVPGKEIRRQVQLALQRGLSYGILQRSKGGYYSCNRNCLEELPLGDATGDRVMEPCPWRRWRFGRRGRRGRGRRSRRGRRRDRSREKSRARLRRRRSRRRRRRRQSRRTNNRKSGRRVRADHDKVEMETIVAEPTENDVSKDENKDENGSETSESEHSEQQSHQQLQDSPKNSRTSNTSDGA